MNINNAVRTGFNSLIIGAGERSKGIVENLGPEARGLGRDVMKFSRQAIDIAADHPVKTAAVIGAAAVVGVAIAKHEKLAVLTKTAIEHVRSGSDHALEHLDNLKNEAINLIAEHPVKTAVAATAIGVALVKHEEVEVFFGRVKTFVQEGKLEDAAQQLKDFGMRGVQHVKDHPYQTAAIVATGAAVYGTYKVAKAVAKPMITGATVGAATGAAVFGTLFTPASIPLGAAFGAKVGAESGLAFAGIRSVIGKSAKNSTMADQLMIAETAVRKGDISAGAKYYREAFKTAETPDMALSALDSLATSIRGMGNPRSNNEVPHGFIGTYQKGLDRAADLVETPAQVRRLSSHLNNAKSVVYLSNVENQPVSTASVLRQALNIPTLSLGGIVVDHVYNLDIKRTGARMFENATKNAKTPEDARAIGQIAQENGYYAAAKNAFLNSRS